MQIDQAQREMRTRFAGGQYGQAVSGVLWLVSAMLAQWHGPRPAILLLVLGGFFIFPLTEALVRLRGGAPLSAGNTLRQLGMQVAFVLPLSMPLLLPVGLYRIGLFFPALMILLGAHYLPFAFLYGMRMFAVLGALLVAAGVAIAMMLPQPFSVGAWFTGIVLLVFAAIGGALVRREQRATPTVPAQRTGA
jgi:hypothetical protein